MSDSAAVTGTNAEPYTVSELAFALKRTIENAYGFVRLRGELSKVTFHGNGHVYLSNTEGTTFVVKAGTKFELVATNKLGERISASPAITGNDLIYRTDSHLYCIGGK